MMNEFVPAIMTTKVITLTPNQTLQEARDIMLNNRIHHLPVLEGKKLVGIITSYDFLKLGKSQEEYANTLVKDVMTTKIAALDPGQHIGAVAEVLMEHLFHAVPIVNENYELVGIVTSTDLIRYEYEKEYPESLDKFIKDNM
jgi:CBS domain-containing protein